MENLTMQEKVFKHHEGLDPVEGYALVIFERIGESGEEVREVIKPGNRFQQPRSGLANWFGLRQPQNYFAIAVNLEREMRFRFSEHFILDDQVHEFDLTFHLKYRVVTPETVAKRRNIDAVQIESCRLAIEDLMVELLQIRGGSLYDPIYQLLTEKDFASQESELKTFADAVLRRS
jgi:hypothetical protein